MSEVRRVGWIGTGIMGVPMARHVLEAGYRLTVHSRTRGKAKPLVERGAAWADTPEALAADADAVISMVTDSPDVEAVYLGSAGLVRSIRRGALAIDMSTVAPATARRVAAALAERGADFLDAPVSGGSWGAEQATLSIMVGGEPDVLERSRPILELFGKSITHCGPVGAGQATKLCNQILCAGHLVAACEALVFARKNGLDPRTMLEAVAGGAAGSWVVSNLAPRMIARDFAPGFMIDLQQKDLRLVLETARETLACLPATALANQLLTAAQAAGHGKLGTQALIETAESLNTLIHEG
ncbi:MAG: NAD(P)-dependent oxidoreductase [Phycisphaerales bacterium]|nr:MAG: NAD(P)-dependent oxidoreductase [Phycisphaerales bacterium]